MVYEQTQSKRSLIAAALLFVSLCSVTLLGATSALAESKRKVDAPKTAFSVFNIFDGKLPAIKLANGQVVDVTSTEDGVSEQATTDTTSSDADSSASQVATDSASSTSSGSTSVGATAVERKHSEPEFVSSDPKSHIIPPDQDPKVRINPEAPGPFKAMAASFQDGDMETARAYADQYVRYQINLMFQVREMTKLIMDALVRQQLVEEEDTVGVEQYIDVTLARSRSENGEVMKPTHKQAMERIKPDPRGEAEVYFFFTLNCSWCREMAPDIERLWRVTKKDKRVKIAALAIGKPSKQWLKSYSQYTGLTMPIFDGDEAAKALRIGIVPAVVIISPSNKVSYLKTGAQDFERLYEFLKRVQGEQAVTTPEIQTLIATPIGDAEKQKGVRSVSRQPQNSDSKTTTGNIQLTPVGSQKANGAGKVERF